MNSRDIIIGDVHGCNKTFNKLLKTLKPTHEDRIYLLGDYIDRGPNSKGVIDTIIDMRQQGLSVRALIGNHEYMLLQSVNNVREYLNWVYNGAEETLMSFNVNSPHEIDEKYLNFFRHLEYYIELDDYVIVHGGLNFDIGDPFSDKFSMVWIRNRHVDKSKIGGKRLIVGHTPLPLEDVKSFLTEDRIMLDGGCVYKHRHPGMGYLCALELNSFNLTCQENVDF